MTNKEQDKIDNMYGRLLDQQVFIEEELDYTIFDKHKPLLQTLANSTNSGISIFDLCKKDYIFYSPNFGNLLGYKFDEIKQEGYRFWDSKIHADDLFKLRTNSITLIKLFYQFSNDEKLNYKLISEYRVMNAYDKYMRVIEQVQVLELDGYGNIWLALNIVDVSPNQKTDEGYKCQLHNFRTGRIIPFEKEKKKNEINKTSLTKREIQILELVKKGLLSKEISENLNITLNTVNTHRQRVLKKLKANNSLEAVIFASKLGLL